MARRFALAAFISATLGTSLPQLQADTFKPSSGLGKFEAELEGDVLEVALLVHYSFLNGDPLEVRGFSMADYYWPDEAAQKSFKKAFERSVETAWSKKFKLRRGRRTVDVRVSVEETAALDDAHWHIRVSHYPDDAEDTEASVCYTETVHYGADCARNPGKSWGTVDLASTHVQEIHVGNLQIDVMDLEFAWGEADLTADSQLLLGGPAPRLAIDHGWAVRLSGYASADEVDQVTHPGLLEPSLELAKDRTATVRGMLVAEGVDPQRIQVVNLGEHGDGLGPYVRLELFDPAKTMDTLAHEAGHMLGLGDVSSTDAAGNERGLPARDYAAMVFLRTGGKVLEIRDYEGMMSRGRLVETWHYAPFVEAMETLDPPGPWKIVP